MTTETPATAQDLRRKRATTADLQRRITVKQAALAMNVSERNVYLAKKIMRLRPDLAPELTAGRMTLNEAHRIATSKRKATSWDRLVKAWNNASDNDRERFVFAIMKGTAA
jgi:hypothetical protein